MFVKKVSKSEFLDELEKNLTDQDNFMKIANNKIISTVVENIKYASEILLELGLPEESEVLNELSGTLSADPATDGLTSEKMLENLQEKGWVFNVDDVEI